MLGVIPPISIVNYSLAGLTIQVGADLPVTKNTFASKFDAFQLQEAGKDIISLHHHFALPDLSDLNLGQEVYRKPPWAIYCNNDIWVYVGIAPRDDDPRVHRVALFNHEYTCGQIYNPNGNFFLRGNLHSLTLFPTDQIILASVLGDRQGCYLHASGIIINGQGLLFVGHSEAGKSTIVTILQDEGEILCDDRMILRRWPGGFKIHGTWSHGEIPIVSNASAPLRAILLLEQAPINRLVPIEDRKEVVCRLPFFVIKPLVTSAWWEKTLDLVGAIAREVPVYRLQFDKSGRVKEIISALVA